jgi:hypothetical protein
MPENKGSTESNSHYTENFNLMTYSLSSVCFIILIKKQKKTFNISIYLTDRYKWTMNKHLESLVKRYIKIWSEVHTAISQTYSISIIFSSWPLFQFAEKGPESAKAILGHFIKICCCFVVVVIVRNFFFYIYGFLVGWLVGCLRMSLMWLGFLRQAQWLTKEPVKGFAVIILGFRFEYSKHKNCCVVKISFVT